jgi:hypothetical protein
MRARFVLISSAVSSLWRRSHSVLLTYAFALVVAACASRQPVNVAGGVFFNELCPRAHAIYTVPAGKLLIIEDASASAFDSASASTLGNPGIVANIPVQMALRTNPSGTIPMGSADHIIVSGVGLPISGGRTVKAYAAPGTDILFLLGLCTVPVNTNVHFSGMLVDYP